MVSSTAPRLEPRWPPRAATDVTRWARISAARSSSTSAGRARSASGPESAASRPEPGGAASRIATSAPQRGAQRLAQRGSGGDDGGRLVPAVRHAVRAARVLAPAVLRPVGGLDELLVRLRVAVGHQVARPLPAEHRVARDAPRRAVEVGLALEEVEEQGRVVQPPALAPAVGERLAEQLARL